MYFLSIGESINDAFRSLMLTLCNAVYQLIVFFSDMFFRLGSAEIFKNETIKEIYARIGLILGLFMIFRVTIVLIQYVLDPDKLLDKQKGLVNIAKKMVIVVVLLGVTPSIFRFAFSMQDEIISSNVIPIVITGKRIKSDDFGHNVAWITFNSFYKFDNEHLSDVQKKSYCTALVPNSTGSNRTPLESDFLYSGTLRSAYSCVNERYDSGSNKGEYVIDFSGEGLIALAAGLIILWIIIMFTIQVAVRVFQLAYLQLIAPIPIIAYLTPKGDDNFNKWVKQCTSTYIDFFIRVAIIYFVIYIIEFLAGNSNQYFLDSVGANNMGFWDSSWLLVVMIIALLLFAKKVPDLLKEVFPSLGGAGKFSFGLKPPKEVKGAATFGIGAAAGAVGGLATGIKYGNGWKGKISGAFGGLGRGALGGMKTKGNPFQNASKGMANQRAAAQRTYERNHDGSDFWGRTTFGAYDAAHELDAFEKELKAYDDYKTKYDYVEKELEKNANVQFARAKLDQMLKSGVITENVMANGRPVIDKKTGKQMTVTRKINASDIAKANASIKNAQTVALQEEIRSGNSKIVNAMKEAEVIRDKAIQKGYKGFTGGTIIYDDPINDADKMAKAFTDNKTSSISESGEIRRLDGSRHKEYETAKANAKYNKIK